MMRRAYGVLILTLVAWPALAQQRASGLDADLLRRIRLGDENAFMAAGATGNTEYTPYLLRALKDPRIGFSFSLARSLAKLDEPSMQHRIWCESIGDDEPVTVMTDYTWIRGWYSVRALLAIADGVADANSLRSRERRRAGDSPPPMSSRFALALLTQIVPEAGIGEGTIDDWQAGITKKRWADWIEAHRDEMRVRQPIGASVDLTVEACVRKGRTLKKR